VSTCHLLIEKFRGYFKQKTRDNGSVFWFCDESMPEAFQEIVEEVHGDDGPDDFKYKFIVDILDVMSGIDEDELREDIPDLGEEVYHSDLLEWLGSNNSRAEYVDDAVNEGYASTENFNLMNILSIAQTREKEEVFWVLARNLVENAKEFLPLLENQVIKEAVKDEAKYKDREDESLGIN